MQSQSAHQFPLVTGRMPSYTLMRRSHDVSKETQTPGGSSKLSIHLIKHVIKWKIVITVNSAQKSLFHHHLKQCVLLDRGHICSCTGNVHWDRMYNIYKGENWM